MLFADGCDDAEVWMNDVAKLLDFALVACAHFNDKVGVSWL